LKTPSSSSQPPTDRAPDIEPFAGADMWLGVLERVRGVVAKLGVIAREGFCDREGVLKVLDSTGGWKREDEYVVEFEEVIGDQGREDAMDTRDKLLLCGVAIGGTGGMSS
jgi:hypothetical protein